MNIWGIVLDRGMIAMELFFFLLMWTIILAHYRIQGWYRGKVVRVSFLVSFSIFAVTQLLIISLAFRNIVN